MNPSRSSVRTTVGHRIALFAILPIVMVMAGCTSPFAPSSLESAGAGSPVPGRVAVGLRPAVSASTVFPHVDESDIETVVFSLLSGPAGAPVPQDVEVSAPEAFNGTPIVFRDVVPGVWTVRATGYDENQRPLVRGDHAGVVVQPGTLVEVSLSLAVLEDSGEGSWSLELIWPADQNITAVEYRVDSGPWVVVSGEYVDRGLSLDRVVIREENVDSRPITVTARLDAGPLRWERYRAHIVEVYHIAPNVETRGVFTLLEDDFSWRAAEPGTWEALEEDGVIIINEDGSVTFLPDGYTSPNGGSNITVDPETGALTYSGAGERRLVMDMPPVSHARLEVTGALMTQGSGWGIFFHGSTAENSGNFNGYTVQFDPGLGNRIVVRQWVNGGERPPFLQFDAADADIDLYSSLDVILQVNHGELLLEVFQNGESWVVFHEEDITAIATAPASARDGGYMGIRAWSNTDLTIEDIRLFVLD